MTAILIDCQVPRSPLSQKVALSVTVAKTVSLYVPANPLGAPLSVDVMFMPDTNCFMRCGPQATVTCLADGTDQYFLANNMYRLNGILPGDALAIILGSGTGNAYVTPLTL